MWLAYATNAMQIVLPKSDYGIFTRDVHNTENILKPHDCHRCWQCWLMSVKVYYFFGIVQAAYHII